MALAIVWGCLSPVFASGKRAYLSVDVDGESIVFFKWEMASGEEPSANSFDVVRVRNGVPDYGDLYWFIRLPPGTYQSLERLRYGEVPVGFKGNVARQMVAGERYYASADGAGFTTWIEFELFENRGKLQARIVSGPRKLLDLKR